MTVRWHGEELQSDAGVLVRPERPGPHGQGIEVLWDRKAQRTLQNARLSLNGISQTIALPQGELVSSSAKTRL